MADNDPGILTFEDQDAEDASCINWDWWLEDQYPTPKGWDCF